MVFYLVRLVCDKIDGGIGLLMKPTQRSFQGLLWKTKTPLQYLRCRRAFCSKIDLVWGLASLVAGWKLFFLFLDTLWDVLHFPVLCQDRAKSLISTWGEIQEGGPSTQGSTVSSPGGTRLPEMGSSPRPITNVIFLCPQCIPWVLLYFLS